MTNENHAEQPQDNTTEQEQQGLSIGDLMGSDGDDTAVAETSETAGEPAKTEDGEQVTQENPEKIEGETPKEEPKPEGVSDELKKVRDQYSRTRNAQLTQHRMLKSLEDEGLLDRDEIAQKVGLNRGEVDRILDEKPTAQPGEPEYQQVLFQRFQEEVNRPLVMKVLERAYGGKEQLEKAKQAFIWASKVDPTVNEGLNNVDLDDIVAHVFDVGAKYLPEYEEFQAAGITSPLEMVRRLKAEQLAGKTASDPAGGKKPDPKPDSRSVTKVAESMPTLEARIPAAAKPDPVRAHMQRLAG